MRFYLVDRIESLEVGKTIEGVKCWTLSEEYFAQHFPGSPIVPGVLQTESMAQLVGILIEESYESCVGDSKNKYKNGTYPILSVINKAKFKKMVTPGDKMTIQGKLVSIEESIAVGEVKCLVENEVVSESRLTFVLLDKEGFKNNMIKMPCMLCCVAVFCSLFIFS